MQSWKAFAGIDDIEWLMNCNLVQRRNALTSIDVHEDGSEIEASEHCSKAFVPILWREESKGTSNDSKEVQLEKQESSMKIRLFGIWIRLIDEDSKTRFWKVVKEVAELVSTVSRFFVDWNKDIDKIDKCDGIISVVIEQLVKAYWSIVSRSESDGISIVVNDEQ